jgi:hypothetical protein
MTSSVDMPFDDCADADVPAAPFFGQLHRVGDSGATPHSQTEYPGPVREVDVAAPLSRRVGRTSNASHRGDPPTPQGIDQTHLAPVDGA